MKDWTTAMSTVTSPLAAKTAIIVLVSPALMKVTGLEADTTAPLVAALYLQLPD